MAEITAEAVRALRDRTDLPMMDCKKALVEAQGDMEQAVEILRKAGKKAIDKRKDNATSEGRFRIATAPDGMSAALIELQCESAPVAKAEDFVKLADLLATQLLNGPGASSPDELLSQPSPNDASRTLGDELTDVVNKIREKIVLARVLKVPGPVGGYVHHDGKTASLVQAEGKNATHEVLRDVAMHVTALRPKVALASELDAALVAAERERLREEAIKSGKPPAVVDKIIEGRLKVFYAEQGALEFQPFAKDDSKTVAKALDEAGLKLRAFTRLVLGTA